MKFSLLFFFNKLRRIIPRLKDLYPWLRSSMIKTVKFYLIFGEAVISPV